VEYNAMTLKKAAILNEIPTKSNVCDSAGDIVEEYDSCI
jgi:hypothetical protein